MGLELFHDTVLIITGAIAVFLLLEFHKKDGD